MRKTELSRFLRQQTYTLRAPQTKEPILYSDFYSLLVHLEHHTKKFNRRQFYHPFYEGKGTPWAVTRFVIKIQGRFYMCAIMANTTIKATKELITYIQSRSGYSETFNIKNLKSKRKLVPIGQRIVGLHLEILRAVITQQHIQESLATEGRYVGN